MQRANDELRNVGLEPATFAHLADGVQWTCSLGLIADMIAPGCTANANMLSHFERVPPNVAYFTCFLTVVLLKFAHGTIFAPFPFHEILVPAFVAFLTRRAACLILVMTRAAGLAMCRGEVISERALAAVIARSRQLPPTRAFLQETSCSTVCASC